MAGRYNLGFVSEVRENMDPKSKFVLIVNMTRDQDKSVELSVRDSSSLPSA